MEIIMRSKKGIWYFRIGQKTFKNFQVPRETIKSEFLTRKQIKQMKKCCNKRARTANYADILGFEE